MNKNDDSNSQPINQDEESKDSFTQDIEDDDGDDIFMQMDQADIDA